MNTMYNSQQQGYYGGYVQQPYNPTVPMYGQITQPYGFNGGVMITPPQMKSRQTNTKEDNELLKNSGVRPFSITDLDLAKARCNHRNERCEIDIAEDPNNPEKVRCNHCMESFRVVSPSLETVGDLCEALVDVFQTIKLHWVNPPAEFAETVYSMQAIIGKIPEMYKAAKKDWAQMEREINNWVQPAATPGYYQNPLMNNPIALGTSYGLGNFGGLAPATQPAYYGMPQQVPYQPMMGGMPQQQMMQPTMPMPSGGIMTSDFVRGGVVPAPGQPVQQPQNMSMAQAFPNFAPNVAQTPVQQPAAPVMGSSVPAPGQPVPTMTGAPVVGQQAIPAPVGVPSPTTTATTTATV